MTASAASRPRVPKDLPAAAHLTIETGTAGHVTTLRLSGTLNLYTAPSVAARVDEALHRGAWNLVLNFDQVDLVDLEVAVGTLLRALRRVQATRGMLVLAEESGRIRRAASARGLGLVLATFPTEAEAVRFLTSGLGTR